MSVLIETSKGDFTIDLATETAPDTCANFLNLCKAKYFNGVIVHSVQPGLLVQTGDPTGTGNGGEAATALMRPNDPNSKTFLANEAKAPNGLKPCYGAVVMAQSEGQQGSQWFIVTRRPPPSLPVGEADPTLGWIKGQYTVFGSVVEGMEDTVSSMDGSMVDSSGRPLITIRLHHTHVLSDPFPTPESLPIPESSPLPDWNDPSDALPEDYNPAMALMEDSTQTEEEKAAAAKAATAASQAAVLTMIGDIPEDAEPPPTVLFVTRLATTTREDDLAVVFARFGQLVSCELVRDRDTGESLGYGFVEFVESSAAELAFLKMNNTVVDDRRIVVDFSQSVAKQRREARSSGALGSGRGGDRGHGGGRGGRGGSHGTSRAKPPPSDIDAAVAAAAAAIRARLAARGGTGAGNDAAPVPAGPEVLRSSGGDGKRKREDSDDDDNNGNNGNVAEGTEGDRSQHRHRHRSHHHHHRSHHRSRDEGEGSSSHHHHHHHRRRRKHSRTHE